MAKPKEKCLRCNFCGLRTGEVKVLIRSPENDPCYICEHCVAICVKLISEAVLEIYQQGVEAGREAKK